MRLSPWTAVAVVAALASAAPAGASRVRDDVDLLQRDVRDLEARLVDVQAKQAAILEGLAELRHGLGLDDPGRATPADLAARLEALEQDVRVALEQQGDADSRVSMLSDRLDALYRHRTRLAQSESLLPPDAVGADLPLDGASDPLATGGRAPAGGAPPAEPPGGLAGLSLPGAVMGPAIALDPEEMYQAARSDYGRGAYDLATAGFEEFLELFRGSDLADNAQYWIGECRWAQGRYPEALEAFARVAAGHPDGDKVPDAEYKRALALLELNRTADGILQLQAVRDSWPETSAARLARQKLESLGLM